MAQSKNDPTKRKGQQKSGQKFYQGKAIKPVLYVYRNGLKRGQYIAAQHDDESIIENQEGTPIKWNSIQ